MTCKVQRMSILEYLYDFLSSSNLNNMSRFKSSSSNVIPELIQHASGIYSEVLIVALNF